MSFPPHGCEIGPCQEGECFETEALDPCQLCGLNFCPEHRDAEGLCPGCEELME